MVLVVGLGLGWAAVNVAALKPKAWNAHIRAVYGLAVGSDDLILSASRDETAKLWGTDGKLLQTFSAHGDAVTAAAICACGDWLLTGSDDGSVRLYRLPDFRELAALPIGRRIRSLAAAPGGKRFAVGTDSGAVFLYSLDVGKVALLRELRGHGGEVKGLVFHPSGNLLVSAASDGTLRVWEASAQGKATSLSTLTEKEAVLGVALEPSAKRLVYALSGGMARVADLIGNELKSPRNLGTAVGVNSAAFSPDGGVIGLGTQEGIRLYSAGSGQLIGERKDQGGVAGIGFTGDGLSVVGFAGPRVVLWSAATAVFKQANLAAQPAPAVLLLESPTPGARAMVGGKDYGTIPAGGLRLSLSEASVTVEVSANGYKSRRQTLSVKAGETLQVSVALERGVQAVQPPPPATQPPPAATALAQPPLVRIIFPAQDTEVSQGQISFTLRVSGITDTYSIEVFINGQPVQKTDSRNVGVQASGDLQYPVQLPANLPPGPIEVGLIVTHNGLPSEVVSRRILYRPEVAAKPATRRLRVLAIGINQFADPLIRGLNYAAKDARDFTTLFRQQKGRLYDEVEVELYDNQKARLEDVRDALERFRKTSTPSDTTILFFSGHGFNEGNDYYIPMHDTKYERLAATALPQRDLEFFVGKVQGRIMVFIDTCHSGAVVGVRDGKNSNPNGLVQGLNANALGDRMIMAASSGNQFALENAQWNNGAFTLALIEALSGKATDAVDSRGEVTASRLFDYVSRRVADLTEGKQTPQQQFSGGIFALVRVR
jgi:hypothetical protein